MTKDFITVADLAEHWKVSTTHIRRLMSDGLLSYIKINGAVRIRPEHVIEFEEANEYRAKAKEPVIEEHPATNIGREIASQFKKSRFNYKN